MSDTEVQVFPRKSEWLSFVKHSIWACLSKESVLGGADQSLVLFLKSQLSLPTTAQPQHPIPLYLTGHALETY
jgi:hypothetical protein